MNAENLDQVKAELLENKDFSEEAIEEIFHSYFMDEAVYHVNHELDTEDLRQFWFETTPEALQKEIGGNFDINNRNTWEEYAILDIIFLDNGNIVVNHFGNY